MTFLIRVHVLHEEKVLQMTGGYVQISMSKMYSVTLATYLSAKD